MRAENFDDYFLPASQALGFCSMGTVSCNCHTFAKLLGFDSLAKIEHGETIIPDEMLKTLSLFMGPHGKALFKAYLIRQQGEMKCD